MFTNEELLAERDKLRNFALKLTRNQTNAEDLLQDTLLRALEKRHMYTPDTNLWAWLSKVMFNLFASRWRHVKKFDSQFDPEPYILAASVGASQETITYFHQVMDQVKKLPRDMRVVINTVMVEGSYEAAAARLGVPLGTIRSKLSRARALLDAEGNRLTLTGGQHGDST